MLMEDVSDFKLCMVGYSFHVLESPFLISSDA